MHRFISAHSILAAVDPLCGAFWRTIERFAFFSTKKAMDLMNFACRPATWLAMRLNSCLNAWYGFWFFEANGQQQQYQTRCVGNFFTWPTRDWPGVAPKESLDHFYSQTTEMLAVFAVDGCWIIVVYWIHLMQHIRNICKILVTLAKLGQH